MDKHPPKRPGGWWSRARARRWRKAARRHAPEMLRALSQEFLESKADPRTLAVPLATPDAPAAILADLLRSRQMDCGLEERRTAHRELIQAAYREILNRPAKPAEMAGHETFFEENGALTGVPNLVSALLTGPEFRERIAPASAQPIPYREIVDTLYRSLLARPADPSGLATNEKILRERGLKQGLAPLVGSMLGCSEFRARMVHQMVHLLEAKEKRLINGQKVAHVISLGTHCLASFYMKKYRYKRYSLPFDWVFSSPPSVLHCLQDDFKEFLDSRHYVSMPIDPSRPARRHPGAEHVYYRDNYKVESMFNHRDVTQEEDYLYMQRTVERFRRVMASPEAKLFLMIVRLPGQAAASFEALSAQLRAMTENSAFICVQLRLPLNQAGCHTMRQVQADGDHALYDFTPSYPENGLGFDEPFDDLAILRLVRQYVIEPAPAPGPAASAEGVNLPVVTAGNVLAADEPEVSESKTDQLVN